MSKNVITVVGSANADIVARVPHLPIPGETVLATHLTFVPGGKGANQAVAAARAGDDVWFVGRVGRDDPGDLLRQSMAAAGVHLDFLVADPSHPSGTALIAVDNDGQNSVVVAPGANGAVTPADVDAAARVIEGSDTLIVQLEVPLETVKHAVRLAQKSGVRTVLNPAPAQELERSLIADVDVIIANQEEVALLTGFGSPVDPATRGKLLIDAGAKAVIVTLGADGVIALTPDEETFTPAFPVEAIDSTGAGDAFVGNFAAALARGLSFAAAVRFAAAGAALSVTRPGAQPSMPSMAETEQLLSRKSGI